MAKFEVRKKAPVNSKKMCLLALELAEALCGNNKTVYIDHGHTIVAIPHDVVAKVSRGNTLEERMKFLKELEWSKRWAEGMCKLTHPDWDRLPQSKKEECIEHMLHILAERAF